jgi:PAS domain S-box-containing protein
LKAGPQAGEGGSISDGAAPMVVDRAIAERLLPTLIEAALAAVITMDEDGVVHAWNRRAQETFGWSSAEAVGAQLVDLVVPPSYRDAHNAGLARFRGTGEGAVLGQVLELSALHRDGHEFPVELRISEAARVDGITLFIAFVIDITDRKSRETELLTAYEAARSSREAIDEFVSMVVHELRQPVGVVMGYADLLLHTLPPEDEPRYGAPLNAILQKAVEASALINDILTAAKIEAGGMAANCAIHDLSERIRAAAGRASPAVALRGGEISVVGDSSPVHAWADAGFVDTILDNLLANAVNYSPSPPVIRVELRHGAEVEVLVSDHGKGIAPEMHDRVFERFVRVQDRSREPGTGLGLYVARHLAHRQQGSLELVSSRPGEGSVFALRLRARPPDGDGRS